MYIYNFYNMEVQQGKKKPQFFMADKNSWFLNSQGNFFDRRTEYKNNEKIMTAVKAQNSHLVI